MGLALSSSLSSSSSSSSSSASSSSSSSTSSSGVQCHSLRGFYGISHTYKHICLQEEIGEVFDKWQNSRKPSASIPIPANKKTPPVPPPRRSKNHDLTDWSEGLLAEFNNIIAQELNQLEANHAVTAGDMRLRISRSRSWENNGTDATETSPSSPAALDSFSGCGPSLHHRALGLARVLRRQRPPLVPEQTSGGAVLVKVSTLPDSDVMFVTASDGDLKTHIKRDDACTEFPRSDSAGMLARLEPMDRQNNSITETVTPPAEEVVVSSLNRKPAEFVTLHDL